jgi:hypothetical protein
LREPLILVNPHAAQLLGDQRGVFDRDGVVVMHARLSEYDPRGVNK